MNTKNCTTPLCKIKTYKNTKNIGVRPYYETKKNTGEFVFLWHNSIFNTVQWKKYQDIYKRVLK